MILKRLLRTCPALAAATLFLSACSHVVHAPPKIRILTDQAHQQVVVDVHSAETAIKVGSSKGIGSAKVILAAGAWPAKVMIRLSLRGLEELRFTHGDTTVVASVASGGANEVRETLTSRAGAAGGALSPDSPYWIRVKIVTAAATTGSKVPLTDGYFEVTVPPAFLKGDRRPFAIGWIDFYR